MNEYVIHAKVKNNLILSRILAQYPTVAAFCRSFGLKQTAVGNLINMKEKALNADGWTNTAAKLAEALGELPDDLFTEEQATASLRTNEAYVELSRQQVLAMRDPIEALEDSDLVSKIVSTSRAPARYTDAALRFFRDDETLESIGKRYGVTRERARQMAEKGLRHLKYSAQTILEGPSVVALRHQFRTAKPKAKVSARELQERAERAREKQELTTNRKAFTDTIRRFGTELTKPVAGLRTINVRLDTDWCNSVVHGFFTIIDTRGNKAVLHEAFVFGDSYEQLQEVLVAARMVMVDYFDKLETNK